MWTSLLPPPTPKPLHRLPSASSATASRPYPAQIARRATPNAHMCPHFVKRYDFNSNLPLPPRAAFSASIDWKAFYPRIDSLRLDVQNPRYCGVSYAFGAHSERLALDCFGIVATVVFRGESGGCTYRSGRFACSARSGFGPPGWSRRAVIAYRRDRLFTSGRSLQ